MSANFVENFIKMADNAFLTLQNEKHKGTLLSSVPFQSKTYIFIPGN